VGTRRSGRGHSGSGRGRSVTHCSQKRFGLRSGLVRPESQSRERSPCTFAAPPTARPWLSYRVLLVTAFVAVVLTFFALFRLDFSGGPLVSFRHRPVWQSTETLRVKAPQPIGTAPTGRPMSKAQHRQRIVSFAVFYANLVNSDVIRNRARRSGPLRGNYEASASVRTNGASWRGPGPFVSINAVAGSPAHAAQTAARVSRSSRAYIAQAQNAAQIARSARVRLDVVSASGKTTLVRGRRLTGPLVALGAVLALLALAAVSRSSAEGRKR
jgi:hypothetical protein